MYITNDWVILQAEEGYYKVVASIDPRPNWVINSGIVDIVDKGDGTLHIIGMTGSVYQIHKDEERISPTTVDIVEAIVKYNLAKVVPLSEVCSSNFIENSTCQ